MNSVRYNPPHHHPPLPTRVCSLLAPIPTVSWPPEQNRLLPIYLSIPLEREIPDAGQEQISDWEHQWGWKGHSFYHTFLFLAILALLVTLFKAENVRLCFWVH